MANEVAVQKKAGIASYLANDKVKNQIVSLVGEKATPTFISSVVSAVQTNQQLAECTNSSILSAALLGESLKLTPSTQLGQYYMMPFNNKGKKEASFVLGYKGYKQLAIRSGQYKKLTASVVKEGELVSFNPITEEFELNPCLDYKKREELPVIGYYAMFEFVSGYRKEIFWTKEKMEAHALKYSSGYRAKKGYTFWEKDFDAMALKTMYRQLISKDGIMSVEMQTAYQADMAVIREDGSYDYVDNTVDVQAEVKEEIEQNANKTEFVMPDETEVVVDAEVVEEPEFMK